MSDPRLQPKKAKPMTASTEEGWWYEEKDGIHVLAVNQAGTTHVKIPWAVLLRAADRSSGRRACIDAALALHSQADDGLCAECGATWDNGCQSPTVKALKKKP